jgi:hypothetical protein
LFDHLASRSQDSCAIAPEFSVTVVPESPPVSDAQIKFELEQAERGSQPVVPKAPSVAALKELVKQVIGPRQLRIFNGRRAGRPEESQYCNADYLGCHWVSHCIASARNDRVWMAPREVLERV